ncbi:hypothetical protein [Psychroflexus tropicus]|uniref:hypothetical protein n=1 Tax=Psychroflexus tropicus TaxID=197345 RepID=UPI00039E97BA|nr:hypothetical protein [Psychroflexus tropicus]
MMNIRNGTYTLLNGVEMEINGFYGHGISNPDIEKIKQISYSKKFKPLKGFRLDDKEESFVKDIRISEINNAYKVTTKASFQGEEMNVYNFFEKENALGLTTHTFIQDSNFIKSIDQYGVDYCIGMIGLPEIESIWEERSKSEYDLPMPVGIEKIKKIILR